MTLEEIRKEKKVAEEAIQAILTTLGKRTDLAPVAVSFQRIDNTTMFDSRRRIAVGGVSIELEPI